MKRLPRPLPAAVHNSHVASIMPSEISFPLKTTMSSRIRTIWPMIAVNPNQGESGPSPDSVPNSVPDLGRHELAVVRNATDNATGAELELNLFQKAKVGSEYDTH